MRKSRPGEAVQQNQGHKARKQRAHLNLIQVYLASKTMYVVIYIILSLPTLCGLKVCVCIYIYIYIFFFFKN